MFLRDKIVVRTIKLPTIDAENRVKVPVTTLGFEESEAKNANVMFSAEVNATGAIIHATQITWGFEQVDDDYCLVGQGGGLATDKVLHVFIQVEAPVGEIVGEAYDT